MRNFSLIIFISIIGFFQPSFGQLVGKSDKKLFRNSKDLILKYRKDSKKYLDKNDSKKATKYADSIRMAIVDSYIDNYDFVSVSGTIYSTKKRTKPLFLQVTASWCAPCRAEIPALNKVAEKYSDKVDFVLLFWDDKESLEKFKDRFNNRIFLVPSEEKSHTYNVVNISGFNHMMSFPTNYLIDMNNRIIDYTGGGVIPNSTDEKNPYFTDEATNKSNYDRLESDVKLLLAKK
ncbi:MAG: TlpA disulfide reductase family protein [Flavobacteriaceae bacterium]|nr:TlpA disulfide reductase family protein [Flavobacteriaceae bacterium]